MSPSAVAFTWEGDMHVLCATIKGESLHCALLLDYVPPKSPEARPLETPLELGDPNCPSSRKLQTTFPSHNTHHAQLEKP